MSVAEELLLGPAREAAMRYVLPGVGEKTEIRLARHGSARWRAGRGAARRPGARRSGRDHPGTRAGGSGYERHRGTRKSLKQDVEQPLPVPTTLVIFGATGDLAARKLLPAIYNLGLGGLLPERFQVIGIGRSAGDREAFRDAAREAIASHSRTGIEAGAWEALEPQSTT